MEIQMRWVGDSEFERVGRVRALCYGSATKDMQEFVEWKDPRAQAGDYLLAEADGRDVGTASSFSFSMRMRGGEIPCQGVAWVGTIKTHRRGFAEKGDGVGAQVMRETLRRGREREEVVSALMPFRGSFYERFGYGIVERRFKWTIPIAVLPVGDFAGMRFYEPGDFAALAACRQRAVERGQCDIQRSAGGWKLYLEQWEEGLLAVDSTADGTIAGYLAFGHLKKEEKDHVIVSEIGYDDIPALRRSLHFLASLRDQYSFATLTLPADLPLDRLLREPQLPHRLVNHPHAEVCPCTRMQLRVLDHRRLIEAMRLPVERSGKVVVAVQESEGHHSRFAMDFSQGRASALNSSASADFSCTDRVWAAIASGELKATLALRLGLAEGSVSAGEKLDIFGEGPAPFCQEYF